MKKGQPKVARCAQSLASLSRFLMMFPSPAEADQGKGTRGEEHEGGVFGNRRNSEFDAAKICETGEGTVAGASQSTLSADLTTSSACGRESGRRALRACFARAIERELVILSGDPGLELIGVVPAAGVTRLASRIDGRDLWRIAR